MVITTGESTTPHNWSVKRGETTDKKTNQRLQTFRAEIEQGYNTLLYKYGAVSAELLKNYQQGIGRTPTTLLALSTEELKVQREGKSVGTYSNNRHSDRQLNSFVRSRGGEDIPLTALTMDFFDDYRFHLKKEGYAPATINGHLCWLSRLMYRAVSQGTIRFNPFEEAKYESVECKPRFLSKGDVAKLLAFPLQDEGGRTKPKNVSFLGLYGFVVCRLTEPASFANRNEQRGEAIYPQSKTENGGGEFDTPASDSGADSFALHKGEKQGGL